MLELHGTNVEPQQCLSLLWLGASIVLLGGRPELEQEWVQDGQWAAVIRRPFTIGMVADVVERLVR